MKQLMQYNDVVFDFEVFQQRLTEIMDNDTQDEIASILGIDRSNFSHWQARRYEPGNRTLKAIADHYRVNPLWLMGGNVPKEPQLEPKDMVEAIKLYENGTHIGYVASEKDAKYDMAIVVSDNAMAPSGILPGAIAFVRMMKPDTGAISVVTIDDGPYLVRRVYRHGRKYELRCDNPMMPTEMFENKKRLNIIGTVGAVWFEVR